MNKHNVSEIIKNFSCIHGFIGKILTIFCISCVLSFFVQLCFGITTCKAREPIDTNVYYNDDINFHNDNYNIKIHDVVFSYSLVILNKDNVEETKEGNFIKLSLSIKENKNSELPNHKLDCNDFKLKDHTGVIVPINDVLGMVGWDGIDIHYDSEQNNYVISSLNFSTRNSIKDYSWFNFELENGKELSFDIYFSFNEVINVSKTLMVLEVDFFYGKVSYKQGKDIILLPRPVKV